MRRARLALATIASLAAMPMAPAPGAAQAATPPASAQTATPPTQPWLLLPPTPALPRAAASGTVPVNGAEIWWARFGHRADTRTRHPAAVTKPNHPAAGTPGGLAAAGDPIVLLHGGLAHSAYWGELIADLARDHDIITIDSRGHGRSSRSHAPFGYELMATDVLAVLDRLGVQRCRIVGWSDGAIIGLTIAWHHPERLAGLFAFGANADPSGVKDTEANPVFGAFTTRAGQEYARLSPTPGEFRSFVGQIRKMWAEQPHMTAADLAGIHVPVWVVDGDHEEAILRDNTLFMADHIPGARLMLLPGTSHFAFLQDPGLFAYAVRDFLRDTAPAP